MASRVSSDERTTRAYSCNQPPSHSLCSFTNLMCTGYQIKANASSEMFNLPTIVIENKVDSEAIPPSLHIYSKNMHLIPGIPDCRPSDVCCDCLGASCASNPKCACKEKQVSYGIDADLKGFLYNQEGLLWDFEGIPIFECHRGCFCDDTCQNRVSHPIPFIWFVWNFSGCSTSMTIPYQDS